MADLSIDPLAIGLAFLAAVPTLVFVTGLVMVVGLFARTFQEANSLAVPVMLLPLASAAIGLADPPTTPGLLVTPIANTTVIIRDVLTGRATVGAFLLAAAASCLYAGLLVSAAARVFNTEQLVNPSWEPLSAKGLGLGRRRGGGPRKKQLPSIDVALALFAVTLLLVLYTSPALMDLDLLAIVVITQVLLLALPALLLAAAAGWPWVATFSLRSAPWPALVGATMVGVGLVPVVDLLGVLQSQVWPASPEVLKEQLGRFTPPLLARPVLTVLAIGVLAGVCEEILYRGPIQAALVRRLPARAALLIAAALFAGAHMQAHGFPIRTLLGLVLGYVVWRGGSIFPAMLLHGVYDMAQLGRLAWYIHTEGSAETARLAADTAATPLTADFWLQLAVGVALLVAGGWLLRRAWRRSETAGGSSPA
jgi:membrane protease YdiL (CAAX protease family)